MAFFKRKTTQQNASPPAVRQSAPAQPSEVDWADPESIRTEWPQEQLDLDADLLGWRNGMQMAAEDEFPAQRFNEAQYMTRALRHHLYGSGPLSDADALATVDLVLDLLDRFTQADYPDSYDKYIPRIRRLPLTIIRERGWQPSHLGGDGRSRADFSAPGIASAVATIHAPKGKYLEHFFGSEISE